jgi:hypothetical protein
VLHNIFIIYKLFLSLYPKKIGFWVWVLGWVYISKPKHTTQNSKFLKPKPKFKPKIQNFYTPKPENIYTQTKNPKIFKPKPKIQTQNTKNVIPKSFGYKNFWAKTLT